MVGNLTQQVAINSEVSSSTESIDLPNDELASSILLLLLSAIEGADLD